MNLGTILLIILILILIGAIPTWPHSRHQDPCDPQCWYCDDHLPISYLGLC